MANHFFSDSNLNFQILKAGITKEQIDNIIPFNFKGKDVFVQFYAAYNGVYFPNGALIKSYHFDNVNDEYEELEVEFIYNIEHLTKMWDVLKNRSMDTKNFVETHIPFARDASGNEFFIEINTGEIKYIAWEEGLNEGIINVVSDFEKFCLAIESLDRYY